MREIKILFRGKRIDNGEWVYGWLGSLHCSNSQTKEIESVYFTEISEGFDCRLNVIVDYKTVGQYTGLTDKNGVRIFEGDIVSLVKHDSLIYKVVYVPCRYELVNSKGVNCFVLDIYKSENIEVIGNIHDNPEILKGGGDNG